MDITRIWMSQKNLRRAGQIPAMVESLQQGDALPRIILVRSADEEVQVHDGHHRLTAFWLAGRRSLAGHEFILVEQEQYPRPRRGKIERLLPWVQQETHEKSGQALGRGLRL